MNGSYGFGAETILQLNRLTECDLSFCVGIPLSLPYHIVYHPVAAHHKGRYLTVFKKKYAGSKSVSETCVNFKKLKNLIVTRRLMRYISLDIKN